MPLNADPYYETRIFGQDRVRIQGKLVTLFANTGRGERAPPALGSGSAWRRRSQDVGAASSSEHRRRWLTVSGKNGKNGRRCVAVDNAISIMRYRSRSRGRRWPL